MVGGGGQNRKKLVKLYWSAEASTRTCFLTGPRGIYGGRGFPGWVLKGRTIDEQWRPFLQCWL